LTSQRAITWIATPRKTAATNHHQRKDRRHRLAESGQQPDLFAQAEGQDATVEEVFDGFPHQANSIERSESPQTVDSFGRGRVEDDPSPFSPKPHLDPGVRIGPSDDHPVASGIGVSSMKTDDHSGGDTLVSQQFDHRGREELAVTFPALEEEMSDGVEASSSARERIGVVVLEVPFDGTGLRLVVPDIGGDSRCQAGSTEIGVFQTQIPLLGRLEPGDGFFRYPDAVPGRRTVSSGRNDGAGRVDQYGFIGLQGDGARREKEKPLPFFKDDVDGSQPPVLRGTQETPPWI